MTFRTRSARYLSWMVTYSMVVAFLGSTISQGDIQRLLEAPVALRLIAPLIALPLVNIILFSRRLGIDDDGVTLRALYFKRRWQWSDVESLTYKPWSTNKGAKNPTWIILKGPRGRLAFSSDLEKFDEIEARVGRQLASSGIDLDAVKAAAIDDAVIGGPSWEDLPFVFVGLGWLLGSIFYAMWGALACLVRPC